LPEIFIEIITSNEFNNFIESVGKFLNILNSSSFIDKLEREKDICSGIYIASIATTFFKDKPEGQLIIQTLLKNNLEGLLFVLSNVNFEQLIPQEEPPQTLDPEKEIEDYFEFIKTQLKKLVHLPFYLYRILSLSKLKKCTNFKLLPKQEEELASFEKYINSYGQIFQSENLPIQHLFKEGTLTEQLIKENKVNFTNIDEFLQKINGKTLADVSEKFKDRCGRSSPEKVKCYNFVKKEVVGIKGKVEALCKDDLYLSISKYCAEPLKKCPTPPPAAVKEEDLKYCFAKMGEQRQERGRQGQRDPGQGLGSVTITNITYHLRIIESSACSACKEYDTDCQQTNCICKGKCKEIYDNLNSIWERCCKKEEGLKSLRIAITEEELKNACSYFIDNITACCKDNVILAVFYCERSFFMGNFGTEEH
jgi:hypothetical protein